MKLKDKNWLNECLDVEWMNEWIKGWMFRLRCIGWVPGCWRREEWMNEWMNEWMFRCRCIGWMPGSWREED